MVVVARPVQPPPWSPPQPPRSAAAASEGHVTAAATAAAAAAAVAAAAERLGDAARGFVLSPPFQTAVQLVVGELLTGLFVVVRPLAFPASCLAPALYSAWTVLFSADNHLGSRLQAGAVVAAAMSWGAVLGGCVLSLALALVPAAGSPAHTGVLCVLALALLPALAANRAALGPGAAPFMWVAGSTSSLAYGVAVLTGQLLGSSAALWSGVVRNLVLVGFLGGGCGGLVAAAVLPSLAAHELREDVAAVVRGAGHAITRIASKALQPQPETCWSPGGRLPAWPPGSPAPTSLSPAPGSSDKWTGRAEDRGAADGGCPREGSRVHTMAMPPHAGAVPDLRHAFAQQPAAATAAAQVTSTAAVPAGPLEVGPAARSPETCPQSPGSDRVTPAPDDPSTSSDEEAFHPLHIRSAGHGTAAASGAADSATVDAHGVGHPSDDEYGHADEDEAEDAEDDDAFLQMLHEASEPSLLSNMYTSAYAGPLTATARARRRSSVSVLERVSVATAATADTVVGWWWRLRMSARLWALRLRRCCCGSRAEAAAAERTLSLPVFVAPPGGLRPSPAVAAAATALAARQRKAAAATWRPRPAMSFPFPWHEHNQHQQQRCPRHPARERDHVALGRVSVAAAAGQQQEQQPVGSGERVGAVGGGGGVGQAAAVAWAPVSVLRPLLGRARQCVASARMEPPWLISGPRDLDRWSRLLTCCEVLVGRVEALGALLEHRGRRAVPLGDPHLAQLLGGGDVVGPYRVAHARAAAACAAVSSALSASAAAAERGPRGPSRTGSSRCAAWLWGGGRQAAAAEAAAVEGLGVPAAPASVVAVAEQLLPVATDWEAVRRELKAAVRCGFRGYWARLRAVAAAAAAEEAADAAAVGDVASPGEALASGVTGSPGAVACGDGGPEAQRPSLLPHAAASQPGRRRRVPILGIEQARALMFMWAVSDGVLAAVAELEVAARQLLAPPEPSASVADLLQAEAPVQPQQHQSLSRSAPALVRTPDALPPEGPLASSSADTTADGHCSDPTAAASYANAAEPPPDRGHRRGPPLGRRPVAMQIRAAGAWLARELGWAWRVLLIAVGWQVVATTAGALATSPRLLLQAAACSGRCITAIARACTDRTCATGRAACRSTRGSAVAAAEKPTAGAAVTIATAESSAGGPAPPLWSSRFFQFGFKYWLTCGAVLVGTLGVSARPELAPLLQRYPPMYGYIAACVAMTERVESTASRVVLRLLGTLAGGCLGLAALLRPQLAGSPPALLALVCGATFPVACLCAGSWGSRFKPAVVLALVTLSAMTLCHQPRAAGGNSNTARGESDTAEGVALRLFAARVTSVSLGCTLPLLVSRVVLPWYTSDWALETMASALDGCERMTRALYGRFCLEGYRAHVAARGQEATDVLLRSWGLSALRLMQGAGDGDNSCSGGSRPPAAAGGDGSAAVDEEATSSQQLQALVLGPLVAVQRSLLRDSAVWTRGTLATPEVVAALLRALLPLADRLAALQLVVAETPPLVHGRLSGWAFEAIVLPMHADMSVMLDALRHVVVAARAVLAAEYLKGSRCSGATACDSNSSSSGSSSSSCSSWCSGSSRRTEAPDRAQQMPPRAALLAAVQSLDMARLQVRRRLRCMRRAFHAAVLALDEARLPYATHPDDAVRVNAMLFALVQVRRGVLSAGIK